MKVSQMMAKQYANPSGLFGKLVTSRLLNRANKATNRAVYEALDIKQKNRVLEIGFGGGELLFNIARNSNCIEICGVEKSDAMLQRAREFVLRNKRLKNIDLKLGDISALPCLPDQFDRVCSVNTIYFWPNLNLGCEELNRVTRKRGLAVLGYGSGEKLSEKGYTQNGFKFYQPSEIQQAMENADFGLVENREISRKHKDTFYISIYSKNDE